MRKLIIRLFALDYVSNVFGKTFNWVRPANIIFPIMCICGCIVVVSDENLHETALGLVMIPILFFAVFFGFFYFHAFGYVTFSELSNNQKWIYGKITFGSKKSQTRLTPEENMEWLELDSYFMDKYQNNRWYNALPFFVNPIILIITIIIIIINI